VKTSWLLWSYTSGAMYRGLLQHEDSVAWRVHQHSQRQCAVDFQISCFVAVCRCMADEAAGTRSARDVTCRVPNDCRCGRWSLKCWHHVRRQCTSLYCSQGTVSNYVAMLCQCWQGTRRNRVSMLPIPERVLATADTPQGRLWAKMVRRRRCR
jgi:hypothetical protein